MQLEAFAAEDARPRRHLRVAACLWATLCAVCGVSRAADEIHHFVDERGVAHFSNVPADPRYRLLLQATSAPRTDATTDRPSVILFAPPLVAPGSEFAVNVLLGAPADVYGSVDITFDPAALTLAAVSVEHELPWANVVRLKVNGGPSADFSAELNFRANASRISSTNIGLGEAALKTGSSGQPVVTRKPPAASIAFLSVGQ
jgi:hypothetical protein